MKQCANRGCVLYGVGFFVGMPLLLVVIGLLVIAGRERASKRMLNERLDKIVAEGLPVDDATMLNFTNSLTSTQDTKAWLAVLGELTSNEFTKSAQGVPIFSATAEIIVPAPEHAWAEEKVTREFLATLLPPGGQPFGYRMEDDQVLLWGFDLNHASTTPPEPPSTAEGESSAELNKRWIWKLKKTQE